MTLIKYSLTQENNYIIYHIYETFYYTYFKKAAAGKAAAFLASADRYSRA